METRGQGGIEYLLIIGAAIMVVAVMLVAFGGTLGGAKKTTINTQTEESIAQTKLKEMQWTNEMTFTPGNHYQITIQYTSAGKSAQQILANATTGTIITTKGGTSTKTPGGWSGSGYNTPLAYGDTIKIEIPAGGTQFSGTVITPPTEFAQWDISSATSIGLNGFMVNMNLKDTNFLKSFDNVPENTQIYVYNRNTGDWWSYSPFIKQNGTWKINNAALTSQDLAAAEVKLGTIYYIDVVANPTTQNFEINPTNTVYLYNDPAYTSRGPMIISKNYECYTLKKLVDQIGTQIKNNPLNYDSISDFPISINPDYSGPVCVYQKDSTTICLNGGDTYQIYPGPIYYEAVYLNAPITLNLSCP